MRDQLGTYGRSSVGAEGPLEPQADRVVGSTLERCCMRMASGPAYTAGKVACFGWEVTFGVEGWTVPEACQVGADVAVADGVECEMVDYGIAGHEAGDWPTYSADHMAVGWC